MSAAGDPLASLDDLTRSCAYRALAVMAEWHRRSDLVWRGPMLSGRGAETGNIAARAEIRAQTPERRALNDALTELRKRGLVHYEYGAVLEWWLTERGLALATESDIGRRGFVRDERGASA